MVGNATKLEVLAISGASPYMLTFSGEDIANGIYDKFNGLQGKYKTWWVGAAFGTNVVSKHWEFIENKIVPGLLRE